MCYNYCIKLFQKEGIPIKNNIIYKSVPLILTVCCAAAIFLFSMQNGDQSKELSNGFLSHLLALFKGIPADQVAYEDIKKYAHLIRKIAHFTVFFMLGILSCWSTWVLFRKHHMSISFIFCILYACLDEVHQFFSDGRAPLVTDILIDSVGAFIGISLVSLVILCAKRRKNVRSSD